MVGRAFGIAAEAGSYQLMQNSLNHEAYSAIVGIPAFRRRSANVDRSLMSKGCHSSLLTQRPWVPKRCGVCGAAADFAYRVASKRGAVAHALHPSLHQQPLSHSRPHLHQPCHTRRHPAFR